MATINQLIVIAGPPAAGKTTLIGQMKAGGSADVARQLGLDEHTSWKFTTCRQWKLSAAPHVERMVVEFNILSTRGATKLFDVAFHEDERLAVIDHAREITFLTLWAPSGLLIRRLLNRTIRRSIPGIASISDWSEARTLVRENVRMFYLLRQQPLLDTYQSWFNFCDRFTVKAHWIANSTNVIELMPRSEWVARADRGHVNPREMV